MGKTILKTEIPREEGYLYYCGTDNKGNITVGKAKMAHGKAKKDMPTKSKFSKL